MIPNCQKTNVIPSLESSQDCDLSLDRGNAHRDLNLGAAADALRNTNQVGDINQMMAAAVDSRDRALVQMGCDMSSGSAYKIIEENLETDTGAEISEDDELQGTSKGPFKRSLSAGNLKIKGPVTTQRVVTRSHTRSQGTSSSQSYQ
ncbi:transaldolase [Dorcoceras hygrometricum]|uniref:Transaldolase n=1 Tax=Dorcoceras hygrometricum TaxID=472368 RepID=A0A2Z7C3V5_9LAMI|nr:transaldolase [Dorcoceras hygrometricum]